jgi:large subunit ribosomal protein L28
MIYLGDVRKGNYLYASNVVMVNLFNGVNPAENSQGRSASINHYWNARQSIVINLLGHLGELAFSYFIQGPIHLPYRTLLSRSFYTIQRRRKSKMKCTICFKLPNSANRVSHSRSHVSGRSKRLQKPNVSKRRLLVDGTIQSICICTKCMRTMNKHAQ